jgi:catechol 2,3-dioxygenase-like lactoylglutathione lyase family enzyme
VRAVRRLRRVRVTLAIPPGRGGKPARERGTALSSSQPWPPWVAPGIDEALAAALAAAYGVLMAAQVLSMVAAAYVRDIDASRAFYGLLGLREHSAGKAEVSAWSVMQHDGVSVLLASTSPPLDIPPLPLLSYFFYADLDAVVGLLEGAGVPVTRTGHPPHALGGEAKVLDPDGNTVLLGQRERSASRGPAEDEGLIRFSILREAAALVSARGGAPQACQVTGPDGRRCPDQAEVKLADSLGDSAWACLGHAEQILVTVPAAFIASHDARGLAAFLGRR